jgi:hypothetical protein
MVSRPSASTTNTSAANRHVHPKPGSVKAHIQMFGGERPLVQQRLDQLNKKWEKDANKTQTKKRCKVVEWHASPKSKTYKKRIVSS